MGWQNGVGALLLLGSVHGTHSIVTPQTSGFSAPPDLAMISGINMAVTQPPAPMIDAQLFRG